MACSLNSTTEEEADDILSMFNAPSVAETLFDNSETADGEEAQEVIETTTNEPEVTEPTEPTEEEKLKQKAEAEAADARKRERDRFSQVRNAQKQLYRMVHALEEDGLLDRDEIAQKMQMTRGEIDHLLDSKPTTSPDEPDYDKELFRTFDENLKNPVLKRAVTHMYGTETELNELMAAFNWAYQSDPKVREELRTVSPDDVVYHVFDKAKALKEDYLASKDTSLIEQNRKLREELAALKGGAQVSNGAGKPAISKPSQRTLAAPSVGTATVAISPRQAHIDALAR